ncbi:hypothetical protein T4E_168 [Trichinella pseudospiralis]|uniref:Uncharacterized protein n=1 Tax=Trichinella pseudospiralis TaxID=6337 RepID=A0A0V0YF46_TRIPS|nr:hypothetical protein T4E_168 [Trichinella pseudospiralis]
MRFIHNWKSQKTDFLSVAEIYKAERFWLQLVKRQHIWLTQLADLIWRWKALKAKLNERHTEILSERLKSIPLPK